MRKARSRSRSLADSPTGSISRVSSVQQPHRSFSTDGSEGMMTRARRRRLLAESSERSSGTNSEAFVQDLGARPQEWRDWANLTCVLVEDIAGRLLSHNVAEYYRFRAVYRPWRHDTAELLARGALDRRFRPRNWVVVTMGPDAGPHRRVLNMVTAASLSVNLPALTTYCHLCAVDGLLVLYNMSTRAICLLDPLSNVVTEFPAFSSIVTTVPTTVAHHFPLFFQKSHKLADGRSINGACLDESTSPPTLVLCLRDSLFYIIVAKPGDPHWTLVNQNKVYHTDDMGRVLFHSLLSQEGRCYVASAEGSIFLVELGPKPELIEIINQRQHRHVTREAVLLKRILSYLVSGSNGRMMLVRYWRNVEHFGGRGAYNENEMMELFTAGGVTGRIEVSEVDIAGRTLVPVRSLGHYAACIGMTHCMLVSTKTFPSIVADAVYLSYLFTRKFSVYYLKTRKAELLHEFVIDKNKRAVPCARPCNLDQYLVCYVDRNGRCINHVCHHFLPSFY